MVIIPVATHASGTYRVQVPFAEQTASISVLPEALGLNNLRLHMRINRAMRCCR
jgi:hypothetical protein